METNPASWSTPAPIRAAFFDIDGTLSITGASGFLPSAEEALELLRARGVRCFLASGRGPLNLTEVPRRLYDGLLSFNGQYCLVDETVVRDQHLSDEALTGICALAELGERAVTFQGKDVLFTAYISDTLRRVYGESLPLYPVRPAADAFSHVIYQSSVECRPDEEERVSQGVPGIEIVRWNPHFVDFIPSGGGKGCGAETVLAYLGISRDEAIAFGDGQNDISMFEACGTAVAMGNASDETKAAAAYITDDAEDDGVRNACVRLGLI